jgi:hypothetical protein
LVEYNNHLWDIPEGQEYLTALFEYATALHNLTNKSRDAITIFEEMRRSYGKRLLSVASLSYSGFCREQKSRFFGVI